MTDLVDSTRIVGQLGDARAAQLFAQVDRIARDLLALHNGREIDRTDGFLMLFERPLDAVRYALSFHGELHSIPVPGRVPLEARCGIHLGEVLLRENPAEDVAKGAKPVEVEGLAKPFAARVMSAATGKQTLVTRAAYDLARRSAVGSESLADSIAWASHGEYLLKGLDEPVELFEVGVKGVAPMTAPPDSDKAKRTWSSPGRTPSPDAADSQPPTRPLQAATPTPPTGVAPGGGSMPERFGSYVLREELGRGGMGVVHKAWDEHLDRPAAIKVLSPMIRAMPGAIERLKAEARAAARLSHPGIVSIYAYGEDDGWSWIAMEFVQGRDLGKIVRSDGALEPRRALRYARQCAEALEFAAREKIVHRDIKPANILVTPADDARVMDFGLAKRLDMETNLTATGSALGTPDYMAPEQAMARPVDQRADIYSLGCTLCALLLGRPPFGGGSAMEVMMRHVHDPLPIPDTWQSFAGGRLVKLLDKMTQKDPAQRFQTWADVVAEMKAIEGILAKTPLSPAPLPMPLPKLIGGTPPAARGGGKRLGKPILIASAIVVVAGAGAALATMFLSGSFDSKPRSIASAARNPSQPTPLPTAVPPPPQHTPAAHAAASPSTPIGFASPAVARLASQLAAGQWDAAETSVAAMSAADFGGSIIPPETLKSELVEAIGVARSFERDYLPTTRAQGHDSLARTLNLLADKEMRSAMTLDQAWSAVVYLALRREEHAAEYALTLGSAFKSAVGAAADGGPGPEVGKRMFKLFAVGVLLNPERAEEWARLGPRDGQKPPGAPGARLRGLVGRNQPQQ